MHVLVAVDWHIIWLRIFHPGSVFARALWATVYISVVSQILGVLLGLVAALMRMSRIAPLRWLSGIYVWVFRGTPLLVLMLSAMMPVVASDGIAQSLPKLKAGVLNVV